MPRDTESHQHIATEQELSVAEKQREHHVEIEEEIEVEEKKAAALEKQFLEEQEHKTDDRSLKKPGRLKRRQPKNENVRWRLRSRSLSEAQKEAQSAAEVAHREERVAHNKESMAQVAA